MRLRPAPLLGAIVAAAALATWLVVANLPSPTPERSAEAVPSRPAPAPLARLEGTVYAPDGRPQAGAAVIAASAAHGASATTGADGRFALEVPAGSWRVHASLGDHAAAAGPVAVVAGAREAEGRLALSLAPAAEIRGEAVFAASGRPAAGARAFALAHESGEVLARSTADASGRFRLAGLAAGPVDVRVAAEGASSTLVVGVTLESAARFPLRVALDASGAAAGIVRDVAGRPLAGVAVRVAPRGQRAQPGEAREARTDFEGGWRIEGLAGGPAELSARHEGAIAGASRALRIAPGQVTRVDVVLPEAGVLSGRVLQEGRPPPPGSAVVATSMRPGIRPAEAARIATDPAGRYQLALPAGEYRVVVAPPAARAGDLRGRPSFVRVEPGRTSPLDLEVARAAAEEGVELLVLEPGGAPSAGADVTLSRPGDAAVAFAASAGDDGRVPIERELGIAGRRVVVRARNGGRTGTTTLALPERGTVSVTLAPGAEVKGLVRTRGRPVEAITVEAASEPGAWRTLDVHRFAGGRFSLGDLPAGPLRISVRSGDGRRGEASVTLEPGEVRSLEIALAP